jgi:hypothetical protein
MTRLSTILALVAAVVTLAGTARADGLADFLQANRPTTARREFAGCERQLVQVTNQSLQSYVNATSRGYLEVVVPAGKGHVFFRRGNEVFDFYQGGFRVGGVRPIGSERYGLLIPLTAAQEKRIDRYLGRLKRTGGKELGEYDFHGEKGFHCVTWMMRLALDGKSGEKGHNLVEVLGGKPRDGESMPRFSRFLLRQAKPVEAVMIYNDQARTSRQLRRGRVDVVSHRELRRQFQEIQR